MPRTIQWQRNKETNGFLVALDIAGFSRYMQEPDQLLAPRERFFRAVADTALFEQAKRAKTVVVHFLGDELRLAFLDSIGAQALYYFLNEVMAILDKENLASITASAIPVPAVPGKSTVALAEKDVAGLSQTLNSPDQSVSRYDFFIAYATPDRRLAQDLCWFLQDDTCKVFLDMQDLSPGSVWPPALREALEASRAIVVLVSPHADDAFYQQEEIVRAIQLARDKPSAHTVIPVILEKLPQGAASMPYGMSSLLAQDATRSGGLKRVATELVAWLKDHQRNTKQPQMADAMIEAENLIVKDERQTHVKGAVLVGVMTWKEWRKCSFLDGLPPFKAQQWMGKLQPGEIVVDGAFKKAIERFMPTAHVPVRDFAGETGYFLRGGV